MNGGYRVPYNAAEDLQALEQCTVLSEENEIYERLWNELHHQGDLGEASYAALPQLVRIGKEKKTCNWNLFGLIAVIEIERTSSSNPPLPDFLEREYMEALSTVPSLIECSIPKKADWTTAQYACAALAVSRGQLDLARALLELEHSVALELLENQIGYTSKE